MNTLQAGRAQPPSTKRPLHPTHQGQAPATAPATRQPVESLRSALRSQLQRDRLDRRATPGASTRSFAEQHATDTPASNRTRSALKRGLANATATAQAAPPSASTPPGYAGNATMDIGDAAKVLQKHLDRLDTAAGGARDGKFGLADLQAVAADSTAPYALRRAAQYFLADPNALNALDVAGGPQVDRVFSNKDLQRVIDEQRGAGDSPSLDQVARVLGQRDNFERCDAASTGKLDGQISRDDLRRVAADPSAPEELRQVAQAVLDNDNLFNALDVGRDDARDGLISREDIRNIRYSPTPEPGQQWSRADDQALQARLESGAPFDDGDLFEGVRQTDRGNCASTAVIKAAMDRYGTDVFRDVARSADGSYQVTLQDGSRVSVSRQELEAAATGAHYQGDRPEARAFATLCYAVMAKRALELGHEGSQTYAEALRSLANGENTANVPRFLGLQDQVRHLDVDEIPGESGVVAYGNGHAVYVDSLDDGTWTDAWGSRHAFDGTNEVNKDDNALEGAYVFV